MLVIAIAIVVLPNSNVFVFSFPDVSNGAQLVKSTYNHMLRILYYNFPGEGFFGSDFCLFSQLKRVRERSCDFVCLS